MHRTLILILIIVLLVPVASWAEESPAKTLPFTLAFSVTAGDPPVASDPEIIAAVAEYFQNAGKLDVVAFNPDMPAVTRAVMEKKLESGLLIRPSDPQKVVQIASALGAKYALRIQGSVVETKVNVSLELLKVPGGGRWSATATGEIVDVRGAKKELTRRNAISTTASSAGSQIIIQAFGQDAALDMVAKPETKTEEIVPNTTPPPIAPPPIPTAPEKPRDVTAEYNLLIKQVDAYEVKGDTANAIVELRRAINLQPNQTAPRARLAGMYSNLGMTDMAIDECKRALLFGKDELSIYNLLAKLYLEGGSLTDAAAQCSEIVRLDPQNVDARLTLGDLYWNQGRIEDAGKMYEEASKLEPDNPGPHEQLRRFYTARKMYTPALVHMLQAKMLTAKAGEDAGAKYKVLVQVIQDEFGAVLGKLDTAHSDFASNRITREDYYQECKDITGRIEALADYLSTQTAPDGYKDAHSHGVLAVSLIAQASGYMVSYFETEKLYYLEQATLLQNEAKTEMDTFIKGLSKA